MRVCQVMFFNAIVLVALGIYGYTIPPHSLTSFISVGIGLVLFILAFFVRKENSVIAHISVAFTTLSFFLFLIMGILRHNSLIILMAIVTLIATVFYISDFIKRKREMEESNLS
jgi:hypothetical protein